MRKYERVIRERMMVKRTRELGFKCEMLMASCSTDVYRTDDDIGAWFFPVDSPEALSDNKNCTSTPLLRRIEHDKPDLVVFKGIRYGLTTWLVANSKHLFRYAFIAAGGSSGPLLATADYVLAETTSQINRHLSGHQSQGKAAVLPKLLLATDFQRDDRKSFDIISIGRFTRSKNHAALTSFFPKYRMALIGDGDCYEEIKKQADKHQESVYMPGRLPREQIPSLIASSRLMVHPSTSDGLPRVIAEAFACGVPAVVLKETIPDGFEHGVHGLMVDEGELIRTIEDLLNDDARLREMGRQAYAFARETYTDRAVFDAMELMYERVLSVSPSRFSLRINRVRVILNSTRCVVSARSSIRRCKSSLRRVTDALQSRRWTGPLH